MFNKIGEALRGLWSSKDSMEGDNRTKSVSGLMGSTARGHVEKHIKPEAPIDGD